MEIGVEPQEPEGEELAGVRGEPDARRRVIDRLDLAGAGPALV